MKKSFQTSQNETITSRRFKNHSTHTEISLVQNPALNNCTLNINVSDWLFILMLCYIACAEARDPRLPVWEDQL